MAKTPETPDAPKRPWKEQERRAGDNPPQPTWFETTSSAHKPRLPEESGASLTEQPKPEEDPKDPSPELEGLQSGTRRKVLGSIAGITAAFLGAAAMQEFLDKLNALTESQAKTTIKNILESRERLLGSIPGLKESLWEDFDFKALAQVSDKEEQIALLQRHVEANGVNPTKIIFEQNKVILIFGDTAKQAELVTWNLSNNTFRIDEYLSDMVRSYVKVEESDGGEAHGFLIHNKKGTRTTSKESFRLKGSDTNRRFTKIENQNTLTTPEVLEDIQFSDFEHYFQ